MFAFPFGQPDTCFSNRQIELLIENGARKNFSTYPILNSNTSDCKSFILTDTNKHIVTTPTRAPIDNPIMNINSLLIFFPLYVNCHI